MFHQKKDVWQTLKKNNVAIALHVLFAKKEKNIYHVYVSKQLLFQHITQIVKDKLFF